MADLSRGFAALPLPVQHSLSHALRRDGDRGFLTLGSALSREDHQTVAAEAHRLRGAFRMMGAHRLDAILLVIEERARAAQVPRPTEISWARGLYETWMTGLDEQVHVEIRVTACRFETRSSDVPSPA